MISLLINRIYNVAINQIDRIENPQQGFFGRILYLSFVEYGFIELFGSTKSIKLLNRELWRTIITNMTP
jgi:hypothetical protein